MGGSPAAELFETLKLLLRLPLPLPLPPPLPMALPDAPVVVTAPMGFCLLPLLRARNRRTLRLLLRVAEAVAGASSTKSDVGRRMA